MNGRKGVSVLLCVLTASTVLSAAAENAELDIRPVEIAPEPLGELRPELKWMTGRKVRALWIGDELTGKFEGTGKTFGEKIVEAGFNLVRVTGNVDPKNCNESPFLEEKLAPNVAEARRVGIPLMVGWQYGTNHLEPYRKYRSPEGGLAEKSCCPLDEGYVHRHFGRWAVKVAEGGADGVLIDTEMYGSDEAGYPGACVCGDCFARYLQEYTSGPEGSWKALFDAAPVESRGKWLKDREASEHYSSHQAKRLEAQYDGIRAECQALNPSFFFGAAPALFHLRGLERGLGTHDVPCLVFSEHEYHNGPYRGSFRGVKHIRENMPALFLCGAYVAVQSPDVMAGNALQSCLYCDGWWPWYGWALLSYPGADSTYEPIFGMPYGRVRGTSAMDYLDRIAAMHVRVDELLGKPESEWPERVDGKLNWLTGRFDTAKAKGEANPDDSKAQEEAKEAAAELARYRDLLKAEGGN
jgi:hypothetical protein